MLAAVLTTASLVFSWRYFDDVGALYEALMLVFLGAMAGFCLTGDLFNLFVFFELMGVAAYALTGYKIEEEPALMGAFSFAVTNSIGAFLVLTGIGLLYGRTGAPQPRPGRRRSRRPTRRRPGHRRVHLDHRGFRREGGRGAAALLAGRCARGRAVAGVRALLRSDGRAGAVRGAARYWTVFAGVPGLGGPGLRAIWLGAGVLTALVGAILCFARAHLKRLLAFSTISHVGIFLIGAALLDAKGLAGTALYIVGHGLVKGALFLATGILLNRFATVDENDLRGRARQFPLLGILYAIAGLALAGARRSAPASANRSSRRRRTAPAPAG